MSNARFSILQAVAVKDKRISDAQFRTLAALGMYADQEGWCWPSLKTLAMDLGKSYQAVGRDTIALRKLGYLETKGRYDKKTGARHSNLYRLRFDLEPIQRDVEGPILRGDEAPSTSESEAPSTSDVEVNAPVNDPINKLSIEKSKPKKLGDLVDLAIDLIDFPGTKKSQRYLQYESLFKTKLNLEIRADGTRWKPFIDFVDHQDKPGKTLLTFLNWLLCQPNFDPSFWSPTRMKENWGRAFETPAAVDYQVYVEPVKSGPVMPNPKTMTPAEKILWGVPA